MGDSDCSYDFLEAVGMVEMLMQASMSAWGLVQGEDHAGGDALEKPVFRESHSVRGSSTAISR
jgi:hypothetical protein